MSLIVDCHAHLYPVFDEKVFFEAALRNLGAIAPQARKALLLVERSDCDRFTTLQRGVGLPTTLQLTPVDEISLRVSSKESGDSLLMVAGRQVATAERLEVLSWCTTARIPDGLPLHETIVAVLHAGGIPAIAWAPGKWLGARGALVRSALLEQTCRPLMLCDTTLRPIGWPTPVQFLEAARLALPVMAGTDPLPMRGEEAQVGSFGVLIEAGEGPDTGEQLKAILASPQYHPSLRGVRNGSVAWLRRYGSFMMGMR